MIWQPEFTDKTLSRKPGAVQTAHAPIVLKRTAIGCGFTEFALARKSQIALS
ncbi:hypothetical protein ECTW14301_2842 [Escherichia coli TW14301]|nr:hypothetical protein ECTW14301_2842 [Escherichia coli TW14301]